MAHKMLVFTSYVNIINSIMFQFQAISHNTGSYIQLGLRTKTLSVMIHALLVISSHTTKSTIASVYAYYYHIDFITMF